MKKAKFKRTTRSFLLALLPVLGTQASITYESSMNIPKEIGGGGFTPIRGHYPYIAKLGVDIIENGTVDESGKVIAIQVGTHLALPIGLGGGDGSIASDTPFYIYRDLDKDRDLYHKPTADQPDDVKLEVRWFILDTDKDWDNITKWQDIERKIEITDTRYLYTADDNPRATNLIVPPEAAGKRIGVTIVPASETGDPNLGNRLYLWDVNQFFAQEGPHDSAGGNPLESSKTDPFNPDAGDPNLSDPGKPLEPNNKFPDNGVIQGP